jgi:ribosomal subunit interface protein
MRYNALMDIRIKTTDYQIVPEVSEYLDERIGVIERHLGIEADGARVEVEIGRAAGKQHHSDYMWSATINVWTPAGVHAHATNSEDSVNGAIDRAKEEIMTQLRKGRSAHRRIIRKTGAAVKNLLKFGSGE